MFLARHKKKSHNFFTKIYSNSNNFRSIIFYSSSWIWWYWQIPSLVYINKTKPLYIQSIYIYTQTKTSFFQKWAFREQSKANETLRAFDIWILFFSLAWCKLERSNSRSRPSLYQISPEVISCTCGLLQGLRLGPGRAEDRDYPEDHMRVKHMKNSVRDYYAK